MRTVPIEVLMNAVEMKIPVETLIETLDSLPNPNTYPHFQIKVPFMRELVGASVGSDCVSQPCCHYLLFEKRDGGERWKLIYNGLDE